MSVASLLHGFGAFYALFALILILGARIVLRRF